MDIGVRTAPETAAIASTRKFPNPLGFGKYFADKMFKLRWTEEKGWHEAEIVPYGPLQLDPAAKVLHYGQEIFEGHKAYRWADGRIALFRCDQNAARMNRSALRMCMPEVPSDVQLEAVTTLVKQCADWVPEEPSTLYIRPTLIGIEPTLGVRAANEYLYYIIVSPVGPYFPNGFAPIRVWVESKYVRAADGGTGAAKTGGNYGGSLYAQSVAKEKGYEQVLWLDAHEHRYIEEIGAMNIAFVVDGKIVTSPLMGSILPGITRDAVLTLARERGDGGIERRLGIDEIVDGLKTGRVTEAFGIGTAAVITPVGWLCHQGTEYPIQGGQVGPVAKNYYKLLTDIQFGREVDRWGWMRIV
ncbi:MAG: branched-chain amino acid aminotransferase [Candidatus Eisenbacteria bacterium]